jgi:hypothetical protein
MAQITPYDFDGLDFLENLGDATVDEVARRLGFMKGRFAAVRAEGDMA